jgi:hypothetical protein
MNKVSGGAALNAPPGVTLSSAGLFSFDPVGVSAVAGQWNVGITITDAAQATVSTSITISVNNNLGNMNSAPPAPTQPSSLAASFVSNNGATVSWTGGVGAASYSYLLNGSPVTPFSDNGLASQSVVFSGLMPNTQYNVLVRALNVGGASNSSPMSFTTLISPPSLPSPPSIGTVSESSFTINWTPVSGATSYTYLLNDSPASPSVDNGMASASATFSGLQANTTYTIAIIAVNAGGQTPSSSVSVTTTQITPEEPNTPPTQPASITFSATTQTAFTASWSGGDTATSYTYTLNGVATTPDADNGVASKYATFSGLTAETAYALVVTAVNTTGATSSSSSSVTTLVNAPTQPSSISFSGTTQTEFTATWSAGVGATSYTYTLNGSVATPSADNGVASNSVTFAGLTANTAYALVVSAVNAGGSTASASSSVTTLVTAPTQPSSIAFSSTTQTGFTAIWSAGGAGATSYTYTLNGSAATPSADNGVASNSATFTGLTANTFYTLVVTAVNAGGSTASASSSVTTLSSSPVVLSFNSVPGLQLWLDGSDPAGTGIEPSNGTIVSTWADKSGNGYNTTSALGTVTYASASKSLAFNGASYFNLPNSAIPFNNTSFSIYVVGNVPNSGLYGFLGSDTTMTNGGLNIMTNTNFIQIYFLFNQLTTKLGSAENITYGSSFLYNTTYQSGGALTSYMYGTSGGSKTPGTRRQANTNNIIGAVRSNGNVIEHYMNGTISEIIVFNVTHTTQERQYMEGYLSWKWGLQAKLPAGHPYFSTAPS